MDKPRMDQAVSPAWALPGHQHYIGHSMGRGYAYSHCMLGDCPYVDMHQTVKYLSWWKILKYKLTSIKHDEEDW